MIEWEYTVERFRTDKWVESWSDLALAGREGWELVSVSPVQMKDFVAIDDQAWLLFFKRLKED
ncbi:MAG: hypothetical protein VW907_09285 [Opitutae bacterium]